MNFRRNCVNIIRWWNEPDACNLIDPEGESKHQIQEFHQEHLHQGARMLTHHALKMLKGRTGLIKVQ